MSDDGCAHNCIPVSRWFRSGWLCVRCGSWSREKPAATPVSLPLPEPIANAEDKASSSTPPPTRSRWQRRVDELLGRLARPAAAASPDDAMASGSSSRRAWSDDPLDPLDVQVAEATDAARSVIAAPTWTCSDGHEHPRPETFTLRRLQGEVDGRHRSKRWPGSVIALGIHRLVDDGTLTRDARHRLSVTEAPR